jgi:uncharacterized repeat protein (TIGR01451 family)
MMKRKYTLFLKLIGSIFALALLAAPSLGVAGPLTITQVRVVVGGQEYCDSTVAGCTNIVWNLNGGVTLSDGQTFILTQTDNPSEVGGENFDTSDRAFGLQGCSNTSSTPCTVQIFINTGSGLQQVVNDTSGNANPLTARNAEPSSDESGGPDTDFNEAAGWVPAPSFPNSITANYSLDLGYADNIHTNACNGGAVPPGIPGDCFPQPVWCSSTTPTGAVPTMSCPNAATVFLGAGVPEPPTLGHCGITHPPTDNATPPNNVGCYDGGALRITAHPPNLTIVKSPKTGTFTSGSQLTYTVVVSNNGPAGSVAHNVVLNDALPGNGGLVWMNASPTAGSCVNPIAGNALNCHLGDIASGSSVTVTITSTTTTPAAACQDQPNGSAAAGGATASDNEGQMVRDFGDQTCTPPPPPSLSHGDTATIGFWANKNGQGVITCENGSANSTALGNWLASNFANLFGSLNGKTNTQVAAAFATAKSNVGGVQGNTYAQAFAVALAMYVTSSTTGTASCVSKFGFNFGAGTGGKTYNVGSNGAAFGVPNNTTLTVLQILQIANANYNSTTQLFYGGDQTLTSDLNNVLNGINQSGDIS